MSEKYFFDFTPLPKCIVCDKPSVSELETIKDTGRMMFVILSRPVPEPRKLDHFIDGYLAGCGVERSEYITIFFNDTELPHNEVKEKFIEKYKGLKFPDSIHGWTTLAIKKQPNLVSSFFGPTLPPEEKIA